MEGSDHLIMPDYKELNLSNEEIAQLITKELYPIITFFQLDVDLWKEVLRRIKSRYILLDPPPDEALNAND